jgi:hypothetical protein
VSENSLTHDSTSKDDGALKDKLGGRLKEGLQGLGSGNLFYDDVDGLLVSN